MEAPIEVLCKEIVLNNFAFPATAGKALFSQVVN